MIIKLESFTTYFSINGIPQQKGSIRVIENGDNIGMAQLGSDRQLVAPVHFSDWVNASDTPYATKQALLDAIASTCMESNAAGIPDAPADGSLYARINAMWQAFTSVPEAPADGSEYLRKDNAWANPIEALSITIDYDFDNDITGGDPGFGDFSVNNDDAALADLLTVGTLNSEGFNAYKYLATLREGDSIIIQSKLRDDEYIHYQIDGLPVDNTTWFAFPVTVIASGLDTDFVDGFPYNFLLTNFRAQGITPNEFQQIKLEAPLSTNSQTFVELLTHRFQLSQDTIWTELNINFKFSVASAAQSIQFQFLIDGVILPNTYTKEMKDTTDEDILGWTATIPNLLEGSHLFEVQVRKDSGNALLTVETGNISSKRQG